MRLAAGDPPAQTLALVAAIALHAALSSYVAGLLVRWPNDLLGDGAKLAGILLERHGDAVVVGIGANLAHHPDLPDRPTTSIAALAGTAPDPAAACATLADSFAAALRRWRDEGLAATIADWGDRAHPPGTPLALALPDGEAVTGRFSGLGRDGALKLRLADGRTRVIHAADVALMRD